MRIVEVDEEEIRLFREALQVRDCLVGCPLRALSVNRGNPPGHPNVVVDLEALCEAEIAAQRRSGDHPGGSVAGFCKQLRQRDERFPERSQSSRVQCDVGAVLHRQQPREDRGMRRGRPGRGGVGPLVENGALREPVEVRARVPIIAVAP